MFPEVTPAVSRALDLARALARQAGESTVSPAHLLHGLLAEEEGQAGTVAASVGLDRSAYRRAAPPPATPTTAVIDLAAPTRDAFSLARELAAELTGDTEVSGEVLLPALLRVDQNLRRDIEAFGLRFAELEEKLQARRIPPVRLDEPLNLDEPAEHVDLARVLDACANRAREGLRVVEDYARFVLDDNFMCGEVKHLRHELTAALAEFAPELLAARDTLGDVGTGISTVAETRRHSLRAVAQANFKRLQEALRSLEEFGKIRGPDFGRRLEALRYHSYTLEKAVLGGAEARERLRDARLYVLLTGAVCKGSMERTVSEAVAGGAGIIQLREKGLIDRDLLARAREMRRWTRSAGALFIVNDRPDVARLADADGVHLGQDDMPVREARRVLGTEALIGVSTHNLAHLRQAILDGASYVGVGPIFTSGTKDFENLAGLDYVRAAAAETTLPAFVIGGVNLGTIGSAVAAGARRVAVSQAVANAEDPRAMATALYRATATTCTR